MDDSYYYVIIFVLLLLSAFFSSSETAFFTLSKIHLKKLEKINNQSSRRIFRLLNRTRQLLITILLGNTIVNIIATSIATLLAIDFADKVVQNPSLKPFIITMEIVIMTILLLIFGEITPKIMAFSRPIKFASIYSLPLELLKTVFYPIIYLLEKMVALITKKGEVNTNPNSTLTSEDFHNFIKSKSNNHPLEENEKKIIDSIFKFSSTEVKEIIVPRVDIVGVDVTDTIENARRKIIDSGYSRIPVFHKSIDDIIGVLYAKDLILYPDKTQLNNIMRKPFYVTENMKIQNLLNQFKAKKIQIAIVVDEYGGTAGLVTLEDILEQLVGEIMDEYDEEMPLITKINNSDYIVSGMYNISDLNQQFDLGIEDEYENLAAYLFDMINHMPKKNEFYTLEEKAVFTVTQIKKQRITYIKLHLLTHIENEEDK